MTENEGLRIDIQRMFPEADRRVKILDELKRSWGAVVKRPAIARDSRPVVLGVDGLTVEVWGNMARSQLSSMKGNITRFLKGIGYETGEDFAVRLVDHVKESGDDKNNSSAKNKPTDFAVNEDKVREYMSDAPDTLPEDINRAISHLRAYLEERKH